MKVDHYILLFIALIILLVTPFLVKTMYTQYGAKETDKARQYLTQALLSGMEEADIEKEYVWEAPDTRQDAIAAVFNSLGESYKKRGVDVEDLKQRIPMLILMDVNGYYVHRQATYTAEDSGKYLGELTSELTPYTKEYNGFIVRFFLGSDYIEVTKIGTGSVYKGERCDVYETAGSPQVLAFLTDDDLYAAEKNACITDAVENVADYYINRNNLRAEKDQIYETAFPEGQDTIYARTITSPCILGFFQGYQKNLTETYVNVFSMASAEKTEGKIFYELSVDGTKYYHEEDCPHLSGVNKEDLRRGTMEALAKDGAYPCYLD